VTTTKINVLTPQERERLRKELQRQVEEFEAKGGKITQLPRNAYTETDVEGRNKRKHGISFSSDSLTDPIKRQLGGFILHKKGSKD
jgi:hypothetical protein